jgi:hypothetical protein
MANMAGLGLFKAKGHKAFLRPKATRREDMRGVMDVLLNARRAQSGVLLYFTQIW